MIAKGFLYLTTLGLYKFTNEETLVFVVDTSERDKIIIIEVWKHADFLCKGYNVSALEYDLYDVYSAMKTSKE